MMGLIAAALLLITFQANAFITVNEGLATTKDAVYIGTTTPQLLLNGGTFYSGTVPNVSLAASSNVVVGKCVLYATGTINCLGVLLSTTGPSGTYVPYSGATGNVNLGANTLTAGSATFGSGASDSTLRVNGISHFTSNTYFDDGTLGDALDIYGGPSGYNFDMIPSAPLTFMTNNSAAMTITGSGNVGIGTTSPATTLDVNGAATIRGQETAMSSVTVTGAGGLGVTYGVTAGTLTVTGNPVGINVPASFTGGSTNKTLYVYSDAIGTGIRPGTDNTNLLYMVPGVRVGIFGGGIESFDVTNGGNVGIGTTSPATTLDINGSAQFGSGVYKSTFSAAGVLTVNAGTNNQGLIVKSDANLGGAPDSSQMAIEAASSSGRLYLGYNTASARSELQSQTGVGVYAPIFLNGNGGDVGVNVGYGMAMASNAGFQVGQSSMVVLHNGNVGIGTAIPATTLDVVGSERVSGLSTPGSIAMTASSGTFVSQSSVAASAFFGDGSHLTGINAGINAGTLGFVSDNLLGQVTGSQKSFNLTYTPSPNSEQVILDGLILSGTSDYTLVANVVTLTTAPALNTAEFRVAYATGASGVNAFILNSSQTASGFNTFSGSNTFSSGSGVMFSSGMGLGSKAGTSNQSNLWVWLYSTDGVTQSSGCLVAISMSANTGAPSDMPIFTSTTAANASSGAMGVLLDNSCAPSTWCRVGTKGYFRIPLGTGTSAIGNSVGTSTTRCGGAPVSAYGPIWLNVATAPSPAWTYFP
jgi:hypothetical protein